VLRGPINGAPTDEVGVLLDGFARRPALWEGHTPPYYARLLSELGFHKHDDVFAYELTYAQLGRDLRRLRPRLWQAADKLRTRSRVQLRPLRLERWDADIAAAHAIYNTAFRTIDGHTDMSLEKFQALARSARPFLDPGLALLAEIEQRPVGFAIALPDVNEALWHLNGTLSPWQLLKFQWYRRRIGTVCFKLLGVLPEYRGRGLEALLILEMAQRCIARGYERCEMSLVSERNQPVNRTIRRMGGQLYRRYRIYERAL
jgi:GNAT superfamily N-acetyltransferase